MNKYAPSPRFLLSGASGMLGAALNQALTASNFPVLKLVRQAPSAPREIQWDFSANPPVAETQALEGLAGAVHLSGANLASHRWTARYKAEIARSRIESTRALAKTLAGLRQPPQCLLVASAVGLYGDRGDELLDETSAPGTGFLADLCQLWEAAAQPAVEAGIRVAHLRFGVVLGPCEGALARLVPLFRLGLGGRLGSGRQFMSWITLPDVVSAILFVLETPWLAGPFNLTAPNPVTNAQFTRALAAHFAMPAVLPAPAFALRIAMGEMVDEALLSSVRAYPAKLTAAGFHFAHPALMQALPAILP